MSSSAPAPTEGLVRSMCDRIVHRGPDDEGIFVEGPVGLGMRRLSIIDLDSGSQPIFNEDRTIAVVFNGEIYNFQELRSALQEQGHHFSTASDTEVIVHLYEQFGLDFPKHLNGMFAIAIWDRPARKLVLARDRLGKKPLYYAAVNGKLVFGSEIKTLLIDHDISRDLDHQAIYNYFVLGYIPQPRSVYRSIRKLPPGALLTADDQGIHVERYWTIHSHAPLQTDYGRAQETLRELLVDATRRRMISDVPLGAFLSGGLDSSLVVALMAQFSDRPIKTFFIDFEDSQYSERDYARSVASRYGTDHHELVMTPNAIEVLDDIVHFCDEPFGDSSAVPTFYLSKLTREFVTVALAGDGGDESFGGYRRYRNILHRHEHPGLRPWLALAGDRIHNLLPRTAPGRQYFRSLGSSNLEFFALGTQEIEAQEFFTREFLEQVDSSVLTDLGEPRVPNGQSNGYGDPLSRYAEFDINWYLPDDILTKVDRMSMANSLEVRAPLLDYRIVEYAATLPHNWKIRDNDTKVILKDAFRKDLPEQTLEPRKRGFSLPLADWFRNELKPVLLDALHDPGIEQSGLFNLKELRGLATEHFSGRRSRKSQLWRFLVFARWWQLQKNHVKTT